MNDIVERLLAAKANGGPTKYIAGLSVAEAHEAAAEIQSLRTQLKERDGLLGQVKALREALEEIVDAMVRYQMDADDDPPARHRAMMNRARQALSQQGEG